MLSSFLSRKSKICIYKTIIRPTVTYAAETWTITANDERLLGGWERKILRKIFGPVCENGDWRIRTNREVYQLYQDVDIVTLIKTSRLRWAGHVIRMDDERACKKIFEGKPEGRRRRGRPRKRWQDDVEEDLKRLGVRGWRRKARDRAEWKEVVFQARALQGL